jgi:acyl-CoA synthetase (AMP-forming)/AMP-acid ligase II
MLRTIGQILDLAIAAAPGRTAVSLGNQALSFRDCDRRANRTARALLELGLGRGDRLLFCSPISLRSFDIFFATQRLGVSFVPINPALSPQEADQLIEYVEPRAIVIDAAWLDKAAALGASSEVQMAHVGGEGLGFDLDAASEHCADGALEDQGVAEEDIHAIFLTSGSSGAPKGVMVSHRASWFRAYFGNSRAPASGGRGEVNMFPLFHWAGWHFTLCAWSQMRAVHLTPKADAESLEQIISAWQPSYMYAIPAVWQRMLDEPARYDARCMRLVMTGTSRVEPELIEALKRRFTRAECTIGWGATELGVGTEIDDDDIALKPYSIGLPAPGVEIKIIDGELCGRSDQLMSGYFRLPKETEAAVRGGWYFSGDLAERDDDGFFVITGRRREIIRSAGETVAPAEVEAAITMIAGIKEVCVIGLPDKQWGETVCAVVVPHAGFAIPSVEALRLQLASRLAAFKHPRRVLSAQALPRTPATGQVQRSRVRDQVISGTFGG